jgi:hypothetical protein
MGILAIIVENTSPSIYNTKVPSLVSFAFHLILLFENNTEYNTLAAENNTETKGR